MKTFLGRIVGGDATQGQARDTGMALVLILLLFAYFRGTSGYVPAAIVVHVLNMTVPQMFRPAAVAWFGLSHLLGTVASKVILALIFLLVVTPIGGLRRLFGADSLELQAFGTGSSSVMKVRNHLFTGKDLEAPY
jgi:hypothetical protein